MSWNEEKKTIELKETTSEKAKPSSVYQAENIREDDKRLKISQKYRTIFNCSYTEVKE